MNSILIIIPSNKIGGAERIMISTAELLSQDFKIHLIVLNKLDREIKINDSIKIIQLNKKKIIYSVLDIYKIIKKNKFDYIISTITHLNILIILIKLFFNFKNKIILREANTTSLNLSTKKFYSRFIYNFLIKFTYPFAYKIIAVSKGVKDDLINSYKINNNKIKIIYNFVKLDKIKNLSLEQNNIEHIKKIQPYILNIGSLSYQKNHELIIKAFAKIKNYKNHKLLIIGEGKLRKNLLYLVKSLNLTNKIIFLGEISNPYPYLANCSVLVHCSRWEGLPNVLLEALALDQFIVSSDCKSGPSEIIQSNKNGILFEENNLDQLVGILSNFLEGKYIHKNYVLPKKFSTSEYKKNYLSLLK